MRSARSLLLLLCALASTPAAAQVSVQPDALRLSLPAGAEAEAVLAVTNGGADAVTLYGVPLPAGGVTGTPGEMLAATPPGAADDPWGLAMTPDGRLFAADYGGGSANTIEYTPELAFVRAFESIKVEFSSYTTGLAWMPPEHAPPGPDGEPPAEAYPDGTLWWMDVEFDPDGPTIHVTHALLVEGDLDGTPTGRSVDLYG
ncbi:MAG: hypothetical protein R3362_10990, partial [Rhodothermales bacterium]|nr:hypothetical protein [Rhodothermales bacterium]